VVFSFNTRCSQICCVDVFDPSFVLDSMAGSGSAGAAGAAPGGVARAVGGELQYLLFPVDLTHAVLRTYHCWQECGTTRGAGRPQPHLLVDFGHCCLLNLSSMLLKSVLGLIVATRNSSYHQQAHLRPLLLMVKFYFAL